LERKWGGVFEITFFNHQTAQGKKNGLLTKLSHITKSLIKLKY